MRLLFLRKFLHETYCSGVAFAMIMRMRKAALAAIGILAGLGTAPAWAAYQPVGPQTNVPVATVLAGGWSVCYTADFATPFGSNTATTLAGCTGDQIIVAAHLKGSDVYAVLAAAPKADALMDTGTGTQATHTVNGSEWYNSDNWAFGFAGAGDTVQLDSCDVTEGDDRFCVHTFTAVGGYRAGAQRDLNADTNWEKVVLTNVSQ